MSAASSQTELRLVVLGRTGEGKKPAVSTILNLQDKEQGTEPEEVLECSKHRGEAAGRQVSVVSCPAWFHSDCSPKDRRRLISSFISLSSPGPHAFLLCVPINQPTDGEVKAVDVLEELLGPSAISAHTVVLFTHMEELDQDEKLEEYLVTWRKDLVELVDRCGERYHTLETRGGDGEERKAVEELLEMVEEVGEKPFSCRLYEEAEEKVKELVRRRRGEDGEVSPTEEELEALREEAQRSVEDLDIDVEKFFPPVSVDLPPLAPQFLAGLWEQLMAWWSWLPLRREALLGALVGLFVGGPFGGIIGATVGSLATEVKRRNTKKIKEK